MANLPRGAPGDGQRLEETRRPVIEDAPAVPACLVSEGAGDPTLAQAGLPADQQVLVAPDPAAIDEMGHDGAVEAARRAQVEVLDAGGLAQGGELQAGCQALGIPVGRLVIDQEAEPVLEPEGVERVRGLALRIQRRGHAGEAERDQPLGSGVCQQGSVSFQW